MSTTPPPPPTRPVTEAEATRVYRELKDAMDTAGLPTSGLYRDVTHGPGGDTHRYGLGTVGVGGAKRLTVLLRTVRAAER
ncbi:hypothetical protein ACFY84_14030 [Streptomyces sp. NPDC012438]|uniref:hypothetical protein n=1 Tax=Streptomyces sp. NPDC012438 TaxID=3364833 RepID=UPI0036E61080